MPSGCREGSGGGCKDKNIRKAIAGMEWGEQVRYYWQTNPDRAISLIKGRVNLMIQNIRKCCGTDLDLHKHPFCEEWTMTGMQRKVEKFAETLRACWDCIVKKMGHAAAENKVSNVLKEIIFGLNVNIEFEPN